MNLTNRERRREEALTEERTKAPSFWRRASFNLYGATQRENEGNAKGGRAKTARSWPISYRGIARLVLGLDFLLIVGVGLLSDALYHHVFLDTPAFLRREAAVALFVALIFVGVFRYQKLYNPSQLLLWNVQFDHVLWIWCALEIISRPALSNGRSSN